MIFKGIRTTIASEPYISVNFQEGPDPLPPSGSAHALSYAVYVSLTFYSFYVAERMRGKAQGELLKSFDVRRPSFVVDFYFKAYFLLNYYLNNEQTLAGISLTW